MNCDDSQKHARIKLLSRLTHPVAGCVTFCFDCCCVCNKANASDSESAFLDLNLSIHNDTVSTKIYDDFDFDIVYFPFLDGDVPRRPSYGVYTCIHYQHLDDRKPAFSFHFAYKIYTDMYALLSATRH